MYIELKYYCTNDHLPPLFHFLKKMCFKACIANKTIDYIQQYVFCI